MKASIDISHEAFNAKQASELVGVTKRKLAYWDDKGLVKPSISPASGRGSRRLYSYGDLLALKTVKSFREQGLSLQKISKCVRYLRHRMPDVSKPLGFCALVTDGETVYLIENQSELVDTVREQGQHTALQLLMIDGLDRELREKVMRFGNPYVVDVEVGRESYQVEVEPDLESGGYVAEVAGLPGCITQGDTPEEILDNARDAIECYMQVRSELDAQGVHVPGARSGKERRRA